MLACYMLLSHIIHRHIGFVKNKNNNNNKTVKYRIFLTSFPSSIVSWRIILKKRGLFASKIKHPLSFSKLDAIVELDHTAEMFNLINFIQNI